MTHGLLKDIGFGEDFGPNRLSGNSKRLAMNVNLTIPIAVVVLTALPFLALWLKRNFFPTQAEAAYKEAKRAADAALKEATQAAQAAYDEKMKPFTIKYNEISKRGASHQATHQLLVVNEIAHRDYERHVKYAWVVHKRAIEAAKAAYKEAKRAATKRNT